MLIQRFYNQFMGPVAQKFYPVGKAAINVCILRKC